MQVNTAKVLSDFYFYFELETIKPNKFQKKKRQTEFYDNEKIKTSVNQGRFNLMQL